MRFKKYLKEQEKKVDESTVSSFVSPPIYQGFEDNIAGAGVGQSYEYGGYYEESEFPSQEGEIGYYHLYDDDEEDEEKDYPVEDCLPGEKWDKKTQTCVPIAEPVVAEPGNKRWKPGVNPPSSALIQPT